jgi:hypothetical protein
MSKLRIVVPTLLLLAATSAQGQPQLEVMPALGVGKPTGSGSDEMDVGPGLLLSAGARMHPLASLRGQLTVDRPGMDTNAPGVEASVWFFRAEIVPAFHLGNERLDFGVGPAAGLFYLRTGLEANTPIGRFEAKGMARGFTLGVQSWLMVRLNPQLSVGPLVSYGRLWATKVCFQEAGGPEMCIDDPENDDEGYWNLWLGVLF